MKKLLFVLLALPLISCSHGPADTSQEDAAVARMSAGEVEEQLVAVQAQLSALDERLHTAEARRDQYRMQMGTDANKANAYEGAEAEVSSLESRRGVLMHRQHRLEARSRELGSK